MQYSESSARQAGMDFTGIYSWSIEEVKAAVAKMRKAMPLAKIVIVRTPASKLSRSGSGGGWSAYGDETVQAYKVLDHNTASIANHELRLANLKADYEKKVAEENAYNDNMIAQVNEAKDALLKVRCDKAAAKVADSYLPDDKGMY